MDRDSLRDSAGFMVALGGATAVIGGILLTIGVIRTPSTMELWSNGWFIAGITVTGVGAVCLNCSLVLFLAHRHARKHICPDPAAHRPTVAQEVSETIRDLVESGVLTKPRASVDDERPGDGSP
jgi:hypothetical protein